MITHENDKASLALRFDVGPQNSLKRSRPQRIPKRPFVFEKKTQRRTPRLIGGTRVGRLIATPHLTETRSIDSIDSLKGGAKTCICARGTTIGQRRSVGAVSTTLLCTQEETIWDGLGRICLARSKSPPISLSPDARVTLSQRISPKGKHRYSKRIHPV